MRNLLPIYASALSSWRTAINALYYQEVVGIRKTTRQREANLPLFLFILFLVPHLLNTHVAMQIFQKKTSLSVRSPTLASLSIASPSFHCD